MTQSALILCCRSFQPWLSPRPTHRSANWQKGDEQGIGEVSWMMHSGWHGHEHHIHTDLKHFYSLYWVKSGVFMSPWQPLWIQRNLSRLDARCFRLSSPSNNEYLPVHRHSLGKYDSIVLVKESASMACALVHCMIMLSCKGSLISRHSRVVRYSLQLGVGVLVAMSCTDLASYCAGL